MDLIIALCIILFILGAFDCFTTKIGLGLGLREINPLMAILIKVGGFKALISVKFIFTSILTYLAIMPYQMKNVFPILLILIGINIAVIVNNFKAIRKTTYAV